MKRILASALIAAAFAAPAKAEPNQQDYAMMAVTISYLFCKNTPVTEAMFNQAGSYLVERSGQGVDNGAKSVGAVAGTIWRNMTNIERYSFCTGVETALFSK